MLVTQNDMEIGINYIRNNIILRLMNAEAAKENDLKTVLIGADPEIVIAYAIPVEEKLIYLEREDIDQVFTSFKEAFDTAINNMESEARISGLGEVLGIEYDDDNTLVVSNDSMEYGAATILCPGVIERVKSYPGFENGFYILPSSVHEVLCVPKRKRDLGELKHMVREVNETLVDGEDFLSNGVYEIVDGRLKIAQE